MFSKNFQGPMAGPGSHQLGLTPFVTPLHGVGKIGQKIIGPRTPKPNPGPPLRADLRLLVISSIMNI